MKFLIVLLILAGLAFWGWSAYQDREAETSAEEDRQEAASEDSSRESSGPLADYVGANIRARESAEETTSLAGLKQTIRQFQSLEGRYPEDLEELVAEDYMPRLPSPPSGQEFDYDPETGEVTLVEE